MSSAGWERQAGALLPVFSMAGRRSWGVGEFGDVPTVCGWLRAAGHRLLNILPINEAALGQESPYSALSAFALDPVYITAEHLIDLRAAGGIPALGDEVARTVAWAREQPIVDWGAVRWLKDKALRLAWERFRAEELRAGTARAADFSAWRAQEATWVDTYALFRALKDACAPKPWWEWDAPLRERRPAALADAAGDLAEQIHYHAWVQWVADREWATVRAEAARTGVRIMGDLPFMVATDSADVWERQSEFRMDAEVGVPPDAFSETGQRWGLPAYDWPVIRRGGYAWLRLRAARAAALYDLYRVDHVVGLYRTWSFPADGSPPGFEPSEPEEQLAHGERVMEALGGAGRVVAEDLGVIPDFVHESLARLGIPGYRVIRWEVEEDGVFVDPATYPALSLVTTGTHDTETARGWWEELPEAERAAFRAILPPLPDAPTWSEVSGALLCAIYEAPSVLAVIPWQDLFGLTDRINTPGTFGAHNWTWKLPVPVEEVATAPALLQRAAELRALAEQSGR
ncbi:MAG: 4-alpha-glucanotransferase [Myxococcales bacterium]